MFYKVIACEIAFRELCYAAAQSRNLIDFEFLTQGYHDIPATGRTEIQKRIDAVPAGRYEAIVLGYGLCSNILTGLTTAHTPLVIPRAHDCITFFLGLEGALPGMLRRQARHLLLHVGLAGVRQAARLAPDRSGAAHPCRPARTRNLKATYEQWVTEIRRRPGQVPDGRDEPLDRLLLARDADRPRLRQAPQAAGAGAADLRRARLAIRRNQGRPAASSTSCSTENGRSRISWSCAPGKRSLPRTMSR